MARLELHRGIYTLRMTDEDGKRHRNSLQTGDYNLAVRRATLLWNAEFPEEDLAITFWKCYRYLKETVRPATLDMYTNAWEQFQKFLTPQRNIHSVTAEDLIRWREHLSRSYNPSTVSIQMRSVKAVWGHMVRLGLVKHNPWRGLPRFIPKAVQRNDYLSTEEIQQLLNVAAEVPLHQQYIKLLLQTGMRRGELYELKWSDIKEAFIILKGKGGVRKFPRWQSVNETLDRIKQLTKKARTDYVYVNAHNLKHPYDINEIGKMVKRYIRKAGLRESLSVHSLRHTFATQLVKKGVDIRKLQHLLGHKHITTTIRYEHGNVLDIPDQTYF